MSERPDYENMEDLREDGLIPPTRAAIAVADEMRPRMQGYHESPSGEGGIVFEKFEPRYHGTEILPDGGLWPRFSIEDE